MWLIATGDDSMKDDCEHSCVEHRYETIWNVLTAEVSSSSYEWC